MFFTYREIDRTIFELIRLKVVAMGYLPDVVAYTGNSAGFAAAKTALRNSLPDKQLIEVFGVGNAEARDEKTVSKIVINRKAAPRGTIGGFPEVAFEPVYTGPTLTSYKKYILPEQTRNIRYEIRYICNLAKFGRIMAEIIDEAIGTKRYLRPVKDDGTFDTTKSFFIQLDNEVDVSDPSLMEYVFTYTVQDVFLQKETGVNPVNIGGTLVASNIKPLTTISTEVEAIPDSEMNDINTSVKPANESSGKKNENDLDVT